MDPEKVQFSDVFIHRFFEKTKTLHSLRFPGSSALSPPPPFSIDHNWSLSQYAVHGNKVVERALLKNPYISLQNFQYPRNTIPISFLKRFYSLVMNKTSYRRKFFLDESEMNEIMDYIIQKDHNSLPIFRVKNSWLANNCSTMKALKKQRLLHEISIGHVIKSHKEYMDNLDIIFLNCLVFFLSFVFGEFCCKCAQKNKSAGYRKE